MAALEMKYAPPPAQKGMLCDSLFSYLLPWGER